MDKASIVNLIEAADLKGDLNLVADSLGIETARRLFAAFKGCVLYIPSRLPKKTAAKYARQEVSKGRRCKEIARELGYSERWVQRVAHGR